MADVCAFVLTRNRRELLVECVRGLLAQSVPVAQIVVLDNASTDGTREHLEETGVLADPRVRFERRQVNTGGAGGFAQGVELAAGTGADWIWLMDDDAEPEPDALERLLASPPAQDPGTAAVCAAVVHPDGSIDRMHRCRLARFVVPMEEAAYRPGTYADVDCASFVGLLARGSAARAIAPPRAEFFIGYDDAEWSVRLRSRGRIRLVPEARMRHKIVIGGGEETRRARIWNRVLGQHYTAVPWGEFWRDLYRVRNFMALRGPVPGWEFVMLTAGYVVKSLMYDPQPLRRIPWIVRFARRGRAGDFSPEPTPDQWAAGVRR